MDSRSLAENWRREGKTTRVSKFGADCSLCILDAHIPYIMKSE